MKIHNLKQLTKKTCLLFFILLLTINISPPLSASSSNISQKRVLILGSYSLSNTWENEIILGFNEAIDKTDYISVEFLDSKTPYSPDYYKSLLNTLNLKYNDDNFDYIITLDDEAFDFARNCLFNKDSFAYKKQIIFVGVNTVVNITEEERPYIFGIVDNHDNNIEMVELIQNTNKNLKDVYFLLDNSIYSETFKGVIDTLKFDDLNIHTIQSIYFDDIKSVLADIPKKTSAICITGEFATDRNIPLSTYEHEELIENIQTLTDAPIYSVLLSYIKAGAIGGLVNDGYKVGKLAASLVDKNVIGSTNYSFAPPNNTFSTYYFNFKSVRKYNINPLKLPSGSIYLYKQPYNILLPLWMINVFRLILSLIILGLALATYIAIRNKKEASKNNQLLLESISREQIKTDFILSLTHELRTPLNIIKNTTSLLKNKASGNDFDKNFFIERLGYISNNTNRLQKNTNNLIDINKIEMGSMDMHIENIDIVPLVEDITSVTAKVASKYNIDVIFDTTDEEIIIASDKLKLERIFLNLLSNAVKFTEHNGEINIDIYTEAQSVFVKIEDNGVGISKEALDKIFLKFKRDNPGENLSWKYEGSGLGLYLVKKLLDLVGGSIKVTSELGKGTIALVTLPINPLPNTDINDNNKKISYEYDYEIEFSDINKGN